MCKGIFKFHLSFNNNLNTVTFYCYILIYIPTDLSYFYLNLNLSKSGLEQNKDIIGTRKNNNNSIHKLFIFKFSLPL